MNNLLRKGFQPVSETELVMVEGGSPDSDRNISILPGRDDAGQYPIMGYEPITPYPEPDNNGGGGNNRSSSSNMLCLLLSIAWSNVYFTPSNMGKI